MTTLLKTRDTAGHICRRTASDAARGRVLVVIRRPEACEAALNGERAGGAMQLVIPSLLRELVLAVRDLAGPVWLAAPGAALTALDAIVAPPNIATLDQILSRVLWAHYGPSRNNDSSTKPSPAAPQCR